MYRDHYTAYYVQHEGTGEMKPFKSYDFVDPQGRLIFKSEGVSATLRPLEDGKPVERSIKIGDLAQTIYYTSTGLRRNLLSYS